MFLLFKCLLFKCLLFRCSLFRSPLYSDLVCICLEVFKLIKPVLVMTLIFLNNIFFQVIRGTPPRLLAQLIDENNFTTDPTYVEDFLLTHRTFMTSHQVIQYLLQLMNEGKLMDRVTRVLLLWVSLDPQCTTLQSPEQKPLSFDRATHLCSYMLVLDKTCE